MCVGQQGASITNVILAPIQCVNAGSGSVSFSLSGIADSSTTGRTSRFGAMASSFWGTSLPLISQSGTSLTWPVSLSPPTNFPPGLAAVPVQLSSPTKGASTPQFLSFIVQGSTNFPDPGTITGVSPSTAVADRDTNIFISAPNIVQSIGLQCKFGLDGETRVVTVSGTYAPGGINCNLPPRSQLTDSGTNDETLTQIVVQVSNYGPCGAHTWSTDASMLQYLNACPPGQYLNSAMTGCDFCPKGKYNDVQGKTSASDCIGCPPGRYGATDGESNSLCTADCPAGYYCPSGTDNTFPKCANGYYGGPGETGPACSGPCAAGYFCARGSTLQTTPTPATQQCSPGKFGNEGQTNSACSGDCEIGYFCPGGTSRAQMENNPCGNDVGRCDSTSPPSPPNEEQAFCGWSSSQASCAGPGYYTYRASDALNEIGTRGLRGGAWAGRYAPGDGRLYPCPAGRYGSSSLLSSPDCTGPCLMGYRCDGYSTYSTSQKCLEGLGGDYAANPTAYFCTTGSTPPSGINPPRHVSVGHYTQPESGDVQTRRTESACNLYEFCNQVTGRRSAKIEFRGAQLATNYQTRGATWQPSTTARLLEDRPIGTVLLMTEIRTNVVGATISFRVEVNRAENIRGEAVTSCGEDTADATLFNLQVSGNGQASIWHGVSISTGKAHNYERCALVELKLVAFIDEGGTEFSIHGLVHYMIQNANDPVSFLKPLIERSIDELSPQGTAAGQGMQLTSSHTELAADLGSANPSLEVFDEDAFQGMNFTISSGNTDDLWLMLSCSGQVKAKQQDTSKLNYEGTNQYDLGVKVCDDGRPNYNMTCDVSMLRISLADVNEAPYFTGSSFILSIPEGQPPGTLITPSAPAATDPDFPTANSNKAVVYGITDGAGFVHTDQLSYSSLIEHDYELLMSLGSTSIPVTLQVCDNLAACTEQLFQVHILDINDSPVAENTVFRVDENLSPGTYVATFETFDEDVGANHTVKITNWQAGESLDSTQTLPFYRAVQRLPIQCPFEFRPGSSSILASTPNTVLNTKWIFDLHVTSSPDIGSLDYENVALYTLEVEIADSGHTTNNVHGTVNDSQLTPLSVVRYITVRLEDVNEPPVLAHTVFNILENQLPRTAVNGNGTSHDGSGDAVIVSDPDIGPGGLYSAAPFLQACRFSLLNSGSVPFAVDTYSGSISATRALDFEASAAYFLQIRAEDMPASGMPRFVTQTVAVHVVNVNEPPLIAPSQSFDVFENSGPSVHVGDVQYSDEDIISTAGGFEQMTFSFVGGSEHFVIDASNGSIFVKPGASTVPHASSLDHEIQSQITMQIVVQDKSLANHSETLRINVLNVDEPPIPTSTALQFSDLTPAYTIGNLGAIDMESPAAALIFTWVSIAASGALSQGSCDLLFPSASVSGSGAVSTQHDTSGSSLVLDNMLEYKCVLNYHVTDGVHTVLHAVDIFARPFNLPPEIEDESRIISESFDPAEPLIASFTWTDPNTQDMNQSTWSIPSAEPPASRSRFHMEQSTGRLFLKTALSFEDPVLVANSGSYIVVVRITDPLGAFADSIVNITVQDVNEPPFVDMNTEFSCSEVSVAGDFVASLQVLDEDSMDTHTWSLFARYPQNQSSFPFVIDPVSGNITVSSTHLGSLTLQEVLDFESSWRGQVEATVSVTDHSAIGSSITTEVNLTIPVKDVNEVPEIVIASNVSIQESLLLPGSKITTLFGSDPDKFSFNPSWHETQFSMHDYGNSASSFVEIDPLTDILQVGSSAFDFEAQEFHYFTVQLSDGQGLSQQVLLQVQVLNSNDLLIQDMFLVDRSRTLSQMHTNGTDTLVIIGQNLGYSDGRSSQAWIELGCGAAQPCSKQQLGNCFQPQQFNNTYVECSIPAGFGVGLAGKLRVQLDEATVDEVSLPEKLGYGAPKLHDVDGASAMSTHGGDLIVLKGENFGPASSETNSWLSAKYSRQPTTSLASKHVYEATGCFVHFNHTEIRCYAAPGVGSLLQWTITVGRQVSPMSLTLTSYASPSVELVHISRPERVAEEICDSSLLGARNGSLLSTAGGETVVIRGNNFGPLSLGTAEGDLQARFGRILNDTLQNSPYSAQQCVLTVAHTEIQCSTPSGSGAEQAWIVSVAGLSSTVNISYLTTTHYRRPQLHGLHAPSTAEFVPPSNLYTQGGDLIFLRGDQLGLFTSIQKEQHIQILYGPASNPTRYASNECQVQTETRFLDAKLGTLSSKSDLGRVRCKVAAGVGKDLLFSIIVNGQKDACSVLGQPLATSAAYRPPAVRLYKGEGSNNAITSGHQTVIIEGGQFGPDDGTNDIEVVEYFNSEDMLDYELDKAVVDSEFSGNSTLYEETKGEAPSSLPAVMQAVNCSLYREHTAIRCLTGEGAGKDLKWVVQIAGQRSTSAESNVNPPEIHFVSNAGAQSGARDYVIVSGANFGPDAQSDSGAFLDWLTFGIDPFNSQPSDLLPTDCFVFVPHKQIKCRLPFGWSPPGASQDESLRYTFHTSIRGQTDTKPAAQLSLPRNDTWHFGEPLLLRLEEHSGINSVSGVPGVSPFTSALKDNQAGSPDFFRIVGRNLGIFDTRATITVYVQGTLLVHSAEYSVKNPMTNEIDEVLLLRMPEGHGQNIQVQVFVAHSMFPGKSFEVPHAAQALSFSYRPPKLDLIDSRTDSFTEPGYSDTQEFFQGETMTIIEMQGVSLGSAKTVAKANTAQPVTGDSANSLQVYHNASEWRWGPDLNNLAFLRENDPRVPKPHVWARDAQTWPVRPGWIWTTGKKILDLYRARGRHDYILSSDELDAIHGEDNHPLGNNSEIAPLPFQFVSGWTHRSILIRMYLSEQASVMVCSDRHHVSTDTCTILTPFEAISVAYSEGNGCPVIQGGSAVDTRGFEAGIDQEQMLAVKALTDQGGTDPEMATKVCQDEQLNLRFVFDSGTRQAEILRTAHPGSGGNDAPSLESGECRIFFVPPPGVGKSVTYHMAIGLVYDPTSSCTMDYSFPKVVSASTLLNADASLALSAPRKVSSERTDGRPTFVSTFSPVLGTKWSSASQISRTELDAYKMLFDCDNFPWRGQLACNLAEIDIVMPTKGGIIAMHGRNFGRLSWAGLLSAENENSEQKFGEVIKLSPEGGSATTLQTMTQSIFYNNAAYSLSGNDTDIEIVLPAGQGLFQSHLAVRVGGQELKQLVTFSYEPPVVESVSPRVGNTTGNQTITVQGRNFGISSAQITVLIGGRQCADVVLLTPHTSLQMTTPIGEGTDLIVEVLVAGQTCGASCLAKYSYLPPELSTVTIYSPSGNQQSKLFTDGTQEVEITGWNFGLPASARQGTPFSLSSRSPLIQLKGRSAGVRGYTIPDPLAWLDSAQAIPEHLLHGGQLLQADHGLIRFRAPVGQGLNRSLHLYVAGQRSTNSLSVEFDKPSAIGIAPDPTPTRGHLVQVKGVNLGRFESPIENSLNVLLAAKISPSPNTNENVDMQVTGSIDSGLRVMVYLPGTTLLEECKPVRSNKASAKLSPTKAAYQEHIENWIKSTSRVSSVSSALIEPLFLSYNHTYFFCVMPAGFGRSVNATYSMHEIDDFEGSFQFDFSPPFIARVTPNTVNAAGMDGLGVAGEDFGDSENAEFGTRVNQFLLKVGDANCSVTSFINNRNVECNVARDTIGVKKLTLSAAGYHNISFPCPDATACQGNIADPALSGRALKLTEGPWSEQVGKGESNMFVSVMQSNNDLPAYIRVFTVQSNARKSADVAHILNRVQASLGDEWLQGAVSTETAGGIYARRLRELGEASRRQLEQQVANIGKLGFLRDLEMIHSRDAFKNHYKLRMVCDAEQYGQRGEYCEECPRGAVCLSSADDGCIEWETDTDKPLQCLTFAEPFSQETWWSDPVGTTSEFCHGPRKAGSNDIHPLGRPEQYASLCPRMLPCEPPDACVGNNTCKYGYTGFRCKDCLKGKFYRVGGECIKCPTHAWVLIVVGVVALISICVGGYILNRKKMHLAFISIGVDYMQVLAIFARSKVQWPAFIREVFRWMSMFNLNIDITAPECTVPEVSYALKWFAIQALPLLISMALVVSFASLYFYNVAVKGKRGSSSREHGTTLLAVFALMFYYMYLLLTRTTFDVFNCQPTDPHDGYEPGYMEAVFEPCYKSGGVHMMLLGPAIATLVLYVIGYPALVVYCLYKYKFKIQADQILRAMDLGETPSNPFYKTRRVLHKLYYHFVPDKYYWILLIIFRKFCIALTSLMFRRTPSFQMALCFCILFFSYAMHAQNVPYMSMASRRQIVLLHKTRIRAEKKLSRNLQIHTRIGEQIAKCVADAAKERKRTRTNISDILDAARVPGSDYLFSYNTMEAVLLASGCFVCIAGIMFQTGDNSNPIYAAQREVLTVIVLLVVFGSLTYFFTVFGTEVMVTFGLLQGPPQGRRGALMFLGGVLCCYTGFGIPVGAALCSMSAKKLQKEDNLSIKKQNKSIDDAIDEGGENTGVGLNPLAMKAAAGRNAGANIDAVLNNQFTPTAQQWLLVKEFSRAQHEDYQRLQDQLGDLTSAREAKSKPQSAVTVGVTGTLTVSNPMARGR